jgi:hypothetical protein
VRKRRIIAFCLGVAALAAGFFGIDLYLFLRPAQVEARVRAALERVIARPFRFRDVTLSLMHGARIRGLEVVGAGDEPDLRVDEASVSIDWRRLALREVKILHPEIRLARDAAGRLSLERLLRPEFFERAEPMGDLPSLAIRIEGARFRYHDDAFEEGAWDLDLSDLNLELSLDPEDGIEAHGSIALPFAKSFTFAAHVYPREGAVEGAIDARKVQVTPAIRPLVAPPARKIVDLLDPRGIADLELHLSNRGRQRLEYWGEVKAHQGAVRTRPFPYYAEGTGTIRIETQHVMLRGIHGAKGDGTYGCDGDIYFFPKGIDDRVDLRIWAKNMAVDHDLEAALPPEVREIFRRFSPTGKGDAEVHIYGFTKPPAVPDDIHWDVTAAWREGTACFADLPVPVENMAGRIEVHDTHFVMDRVTGTAARGTLEVAGLASPDLVDVRIAARGIEASPALREALPPGGKVPFDAVSPAGPLDVAIGVKGERDAATGRLDPRFVARLTPRPGLTVRWREMPLPLEARGGDVTISEDGGVIAGFTAGRGAFSVTVDGSIGAEDRGTPIALDIAASGLEVDPALRDALRGWARELVEEAGLEAGRVAEAWVSVRKPPGEGAKLAVSGRCAFDGVRLRPLRLPYPLEGLKGRAHFDPSSVTLESLAGSAGGAPLLGSGVVSLDPAAPSTAGLTIEGVPIDAALRRAIEQAGLRVFDQLSLDGGRLDLAVALRGGGATLAPAAEVRVRGATALLRRFPYPVTRIEAEASYADGRARLDRLQGLLGPAPIEVRGELGPLDAADPAQLVGRASIFVADLPLDRRLREALPPPLRRVATESDLAGRATVQASLLVAPHAPRPSIIYAAEVALEGVRADFGLLLKEISGTVFVEGETPIAAPDLTRLRGALEIASASWKQQAITHLAAGYTLGDGLFELREARGRMLGGLLRANVYAYYDDPALFGGEVHLVGGRLERWIPRKYSGRLDAAVAFSGEAGGAGGAGRLRGQGNLSIGRANLWELPAIARILNVLSFEPPTRAVFDDGEFALRLDGKKIIIDRAVLSSPALSFMGRGQIVDGEVDMRLTHELGRPFVARIPLLGALWEFFKENLIEIEVRGPLDDPKIRPIPVKAVTNPIRWIFGGGEEAPRSKKRMEE